MRLRVFLVTTMVVLMLAAFPARTVQASSSDIVISQVYGGGGNSGAPYLNDFIELFNRGNTTVSLAGMSVQYASATGTGSFGSNPVTLLSGSLAPGQYYLVQQSGGATGAPLPTPDATGTVAMSASSGKVALVNSTAGLACNGGSTPCSAAQLALIKDLVGYGGANFYEGSPAPGLSNTTAALRLADGCTETDNNAVDFAAGAPNPRNTSAPLNPCLAQDTAPTVTGTFPADGATDFPVHADLSITFSEPVNVASSWFTLTCSVSGNIATTFSGGPTTFTLDPGVSLTGGETCTLTVLANQVSDQDAADPPDNMAGNFTMEFQAFDACAAPYTPIYTIQGSGLSAAVTGTVTTQGVVTGDFEGSTGLQGFYLQDPTGDADAATSDGIFVFTGSNDLVSAGQRVRVTGYARERFGQTAINGSNSNASPVPAANIVACGTGSVVPTTVMLPFDNADFPERYEGMLVRFPQSLVISEYFNYDRFGEIVIALPLGGETRPFTGTAIDAPGAPALARTFANELSRLTLDDGFNTQNPSFLRHPNGAPFDLGNRFRGGDTLTDTVGILGFDFSLYRIQPTAPAQYTPVNPPPVSLDPVGGTLRVAGMNTLNFFLTLDYPPGDPLDNTCGPLNNVECRGADSDQPLEFSRQRQKLLAALAGLNADIVGLTEMENTAGVDPLGDPGGIVAGLNDLLGAGTYDSIPTGTIGSDGIRSGLIYKPARVTPVGVFKVLDSTQDPRFIDTKNRPALAQTFQDVIHGGRLTVVVNHFKSKGSDCLDVGDPDVGDGQGNCNLTRLAAAQALVDWLATDPTGSGDRDVLIIGDLNSYAREDPVGAMEAGPDDVAGTADDYTNLFARFQGPYDYSFVFDGQSGYLDHALANASLLGQITGAAHPHINADEPDVFDYDTSFKPPEQDALYEPNGFRSSDHDPILLGLDLAHYNFSGFLPPVYDAPVWNESKAGSSVPVKFSLGGFQGLDILQGNPTSRQVPCGSVPSPAAGEETNTPGSSSLSFSATSDQYTYVWKTDKAWEGTCRQLVLVFKDGSVHAANFSFK